MGSGTSVEFKGRSMARLKKIWKREFQSVEEFITDQRMELLRSGNPNLACFDSRKHRLRLVFYVPATVYRQLRVSISPVPGFDMPTTEGGEPDVDALFGLTESMVREITGDDRLVPTRRGVTESGTLLLRYIFLPDTDVVCTEEELEESQPSAMDTGDPKPDDADE
jgi:hypothetical protein